MWGPNKRKKATAGQIFERSFVILASAVNTLQVTDDTAANPPPVPAADPPSNCTNSALQRIQTRQGTVE